MKGEDIYLKSPFVLQQIFVNLQGFKIRRSRFNKQFRYWFEKYKLSDPEKINEEALFKFLNHANETQFWKERFDKFDVKIINNKNLISEIQKLPIITKKEVKEFIHLIKNENIHDKIYLAHTSGTTGSGLVFPQTREMENKQWAVWWRYRSWHNIKLNTWMGWFGGRSIVSIKQTKPPFWRLNYPMKQVMFSAHHLNEKTVHFYFDEIKKRKLTWLHGYPSQLSLLAHLIKNNNLGALPNVKIITVGAENLLVAQKKIIEEVFNAPVKQHYGLAEGVANISEHPGGSLIPDQDFAFTEFIPVDKNNPEICRIVGTNYNNLAFPLIRYDTGDIAHIKWNDDGTPSVLSIDGRQEDYITLPNGVKLGRLDHIFKDLTEVQEAQLFQPNLENVIIRIVKGPNYDKVNQEKSVIFETRKRLGNEINISIEYLRQIPKTKSGKLRFVISEIK
jgi:phenylacetate-CoA ligase